MNTASSNFNSNALLWAVTGPALIALTFFIAAFRPMPTSWEIPAVTLVGMLICCKWSWRGVLISLFLLGCVLAYSLHIMASSEMLWLIAMACTVACAFVVTVLTLEEAGSSLDVLRKENHEQKCAFSLLNQKIENLQNESKIQQEALTLQIDQLNHDQKQKQNKIESSEKLIFLARDELTKTHAQQQKTLQELIEARKKITLLESKLTDQPMLASQAAQVEELKGKICHKDKEIETLKQNLDQAKTLQQNFSKIESEFHSLQKKSQSELSRISELNQLTERQKMAILELQSQVDVLKSEKSLLESSIAELQARSVQVESPNVELTREIKRVEGLYNQLREQFSQKNALLDSTRQELFKTQEQLQNLIRISKK